MTEEEKFGLTIAVIAGSILLIILVSVIVTWLYNKYNERPKVKKIGPYWFIYRISDGMRQYYEVTESQSDWWYDITTPYISRFTTEESAIAHLPPKPLGYFKKKRVERERKKEEQRVLREREERLKAHKEKMLKVRLDFSDYG